MYNAFKLDIIFGGLKPNEDSFYEDPVGCTTGESVCDTIPQAILA